MLPARDGFEVCAALRERGCWAPVLILPARGQVADRTRGLDAGADDYLPKPFDFGELLARLRALIRRAPGERPAAIEAGELRGGPPSRQGTLARREGGLTPPGVAVLELLPPNPRGGVTPAPRPHPAWGTNFEGPA